MYLSLVCGCVLCLSFILPLFLFDFFMLISRPLCFEDEMYSRRKGVSDEVKLALSRNGSREILYFKGVYKVYR